MCVLHSVDDTISPDRKSIVCKGWKLINVKMILVMFLLLCIIVSDFGLQYKQKNSFTLTIKAFPLLEGVVHLTQTKP